MDFTKFDEYYRLYLGCTDFEGQYIIVENILRDKPLANVFYQYMIASFYKDDYIISISPQYKRWFEDVYQFGKVLPKIDDELLKIDNLFADRLGSYRLSKKYRMTITETPVAGLPHTDRIELLNKNHKSIYFDYYGLRGNKYKEYLWANLLDSFEEDGCFIIIDDGIPVSRAYISDIDCNGANIVVSTAPSARKKGYGKALVARVTKWCQNKGILPIYLVDQANIASIKLAQNLGYSIMSQEIILMSQKPPKN